ncbi:MAG: cupin domain-containing protein [Verrucomicrobiaceae bacterium]|nr:MAG: cupin domain-containing protein [Verrucomicrobiaceae bacterium]
MNTKPKLHQVVLLTVCAILLPTGGFAEEPVRVTDLILKELPDVADKEVQVITVDYAPGAKDPVHRHDAHAFVYVLEGSIIMQMKGEEAVTLKPGEIFYEDPRLIHLVGKNASDTKPAKFLVFLVKKKGAPLLRLEHE